MYRTQCLLEEFVSSTHKPYTKHLIYIYILRREGALLYALHDDCINCIPTVYSENTSKCHVFTFQLISFGFSICFNGWRFCTKSERYSIASAVRHIKYSNLFGWSLDWCLYAVYIQGIAYKFQAAIELPHIQNMCMRQRTTIHRHSNHIYRQSSLVITRHCFKSMIALHLMRYWSLYGG